MIEHMLWEHKYRPKSIDQVILPERLKQMFGQFVKNKEVPNLILSGGPGIGKTTCALAMLNQLDYSYMLINGSLDGNIDTLRTQIKEFASSMSLKGKRKFVILDEADHLTAATQPALRSFMDEFASSCGFILTCNYKHRIIEPLHSRCSMIEFAFSKQEKAEIARQMFTAVKSMLKVELIEFDQKSVAALVGKHFPDFRKVINELQKYSASGKIDSGILTDFDSVQFAQLIDMLKQKQFSALFKWVAEQSDLEDHTIYRKLYDNALEACAEMTDSAQLVLIISKYMHQSAFAADKQVNLLACLTEIMIEVSFK